jgi:hypothetical protein
MTADTPNRVSGAVCPFDLTVDVIDRMLNFEIADDPTYTGLEMQAFYDPEYGTGILALLARRDDGHAYVYRLPGLRLDPIKFQVVHGLGGWTEARLTRPASTSVSTASMRRSGSAMMPVARSRCASTTAAAAASQRGCSPPLARSSSTRHHCSWRTCVALICCDARAASSASSSTGAKSGLAHCREAGCIGVDW